jgi:hypothetical protein
MALSNQLRAIADKVRADTGQQQNIGNANVATQANQAIQQTATTGPQAKASAQQIAAGTTAGQAQVATQAAAGQQQIMGQLGNQVLQQAGQAKQQSLNEQQLLNDSQISELQRSGQLRQNSAALEQSKRLQAKELGVQKRLTSAKMDYDNSLSFMTRKQREDLSNISQYTKQILFDQRLMFQKSEDGRRFSNMQQLADYSVANFRENQQLQTKMREMEQAAAREMSILQHAHSMVSQKLELEFQRAERQKDYRLMKDLQAKKNALAEKMRRKAAQGAMISNVIVGGSMIAGAAITGSPAGAIAGKGAGEVVAGGLQSAEVY